MKITAQEAKCSPGGHRRALKLIFATVSKMAPNLTGFNRRTFMLVSFYFELN